MTETHYCPVACFADGSVNLAGLRCLGISFTCGHGFHCVKDPEAVRHLKDQFYDCRPNTRKRWYGMPWRG